LKRSLNHDNFAGLQMKMIHVLEQTQEPHGYNPTTPPPSLFFFYRLIKFIKQTIIRYKQKTTTYIAGLYASYCDF
jgi:hypothetical protein